MTESNTTVAETIEFAKAAYEDARSIQVRGFGYLGIFDWSGGIYDDDQLHDELYVPLGILAEAASPDNKEVLVAEAQIYHAIACNRAYNTIHSITEPGSSLTGRDLFENFANAFQALFMELNLWEHAEKTFGETRLFEKANVYVARAGILGFMGANDEAIDLYVRAAMYCHALNPLLDDPAQLLYHDILATSEGIISNDEFFSKMQERLG